MNMIRKIIKIDEDKCSGCGLCAQACHEGAIEMIDGKAKLTREDYCDGLGDCLPACPTGAITFEEREAPTYNEAAVLAAKKNKSSGCSSAAEAAAQSATSPAAQSSTQSAAQSSAQSATSSAVQSSAQSSALPCGCPGTLAKSIHRHERSRSDKLTTTAAETVSLSAPAGSKLSQWPVQIKLVPVNAPYFDGADLLIAADCTAYAYGSFHNDFIKNRITLIGCPKLDEGDYAEKLTEILLNNEIKSVTVVRMEVPCCGGIEHAVKKALQASGKFIPWSVVTISTDGKILE